MSILACVDPDLWEGIVYLRRVHVYVSGRVQGVYFRHHTQQQALRHNVSGWIKNLPDGRVEALFEGTERDIDAMLSFCRTGPPRADVEHVDAIEEPFVGEFRDFSIRR